VWPIPKASDKQRIPEFCFYAVLEELSFGSKMMLRLVHAAIIRKDSRGERKILLYRGDRSKVSDQRWQN
jgi:hypothetical protein